MAAARRWAVETGGGTAGHGLGGRQWVWVGDGGEEDTGSELGFGAGAIRAEDLATKNHRRRGRRVESAMEKATGSAAVVEEAGDAGAAPASATALGGGSGGRGVAAAV